MAESLGGFESLAELPYTMTHASVEEKERVALGVTENLIRSASGIIKPISGPLNLGHLYTGV